MTKFEDVSRELERRGKGDALKKLAESDDGQKISRMIDAQKLENAAKSGDSKALHDMLSAVLSTDEGRRLAENVKKMMNG